MNKKYRNLLIAAVILFLGFNYFSCSNGGTGGRSLWSTTQESPLKNNPSVQKAWEVQSAFRSIYDLYKERVVSISTEQNIAVPEFYTFFYGAPAVQKQQGLGTGFIVSDDGFVCTNFHVVAPAGVIVDKITVHIGEKSYNAEVRGYDEKLDIALVKIEGGKNFKPVYLGNSDEVQVGDWAIAIGNSFGLEQTFTSGVISAVNRTNVDANETFIQTDAAINPGNSGGPLININGEVIGVNRMIFSKSGGYMGIGFAIPINNVKLILEKLKKQKFVEKGYIGVSLIPMATQYAKQLGWNRNYGAIVNSVEQNGPADVAGIMRGDIIYEINGKKVTDVDVLIAEVEKAGPAGRLTVKVWRQGRERQYILRPAKKPASIQQ
ncbi:MAG: trypsin-like peptidase domain-containing protein [Spirochaetes bacterium]|nr:trypsin-like peptidase domain-containing protein [Spirochaetota bacterium]